MLYTGTADGKLIEYWFKNMLIPVLPPNSVIILDNASIHKVESVKKVVLESGHQMIYLPPYSPELNPIEKKWNQIKQLLKGYYDNTVDFIDNLIFQINKLSSPI